MTGDRQASEDITQEVFLQLWKRPNGFDIARGSLISYVFGIARKLGAEWWRHRAPVALEVLESEQDAVSASPPQPATAETGMIMEDALARLEIDARSLLWLREVEGHSYAELAEIFGIPVGTVRYRLFTAREELRGLWKTKNTARE